MEKAMCKIKYKKYDKDIKLSKAMGFFCEFKNFPIQYALITNNHVIDENNININKKITIEYIEYNNEKKKRKKKRN